jgi:hypothetical protein
MRDMRECCIIHKRHCWRWGTDRKPSVVLWVPREVRDEYISLSIPCVHVGALVSL